MISIKRSSTPAACKKIEMTCHIRLHPWSILCPGLAQCPTQEHITITVQRRSSSLFCMHMIVIYPAPLCQGLPPEQKSAGAAAPGLSRRGDAERSEAPKNILCIFYKMEHRRVCGVASPSFPAFRPGWCGSSKAKRFQPDFYCRRAL